jgi:hypothetical protein
MDKTTILVRHYMKTDKMEGFEFETIHSIRIDEELESDYFRLEIHDTGDKYIMVASPDDYFVSEDVTTFFNLPMIEQECREQLKSGRVIDNSKEFIEFLRLVEEEENHF